MRNQNKNKKVKIFCEMSSILEQVQYNLLLSKALVQLMPKQERDHIQLWLDVIDSYEDTDENLTLKHEYIYFILLMLQNNKIEDYFRELPPKTLLSLKKVVPKAIIDEVLAELNENLSWLDSATDEKIEQKQLEQRKIPPEAFFVNQPLPKDGVICYFGTFTNHL